MSAEDSICPKGWRIPTYSGSWQNPEPFEWARLIRSYEIPMNSTGNAYGANRIRRWPLDYMSTGEYYTDSGYIGNRTTRGGWWNRVGISYHDFINGSALIVNGSGISDETNLKRGYGLAIRCVVRS